MCEKLRNKMQKKGDKQKSGNLMIKENYFKRIEYCGGNDLALLSASVVMAVCHDSRVFHTR